MSECAKIQSFECYSITTFTFFLFIKKLRFFEILKFTWIYYIKLIRTNNLTAQKQSIYEPYMLIL